MKVKTTKAMAKELNKNSSYNVFFTAMSENEFAWCVDLDTLNHLDDYNSGTSKFSVIGVEYPARYFANNKYITTNDLLKIFDKSDGTWDSFVKEFNAFVEI